MMTARGASTRANGARTTRGHAGRRARAEGRRGGTRTRSAGGRFDAKSANATDSETTTTAATRETVAEDGDGANEAVRRVAEDHVRAMEALKDGGVGGRGTRKSREAASTRRDFRARDARCVVLAGGADETNPLTRGRARSAVHLGGAYRVIDFPLTNLINSGMRQVYVLTQYNSHSLVTHVNRAFPMEMFGNNNEGFVEVLPTSQTREHGETWSMGSADCVARHLTHGSLTKHSFDMRLEDECLQRHGSLEACAANQTDGITIVLAAEQLYTMDFNKLLEAHLKSEADVTVATCDQVTAENASRLGIMDVDEHTSSILSFIEKPSADQLLEFMQCSTENELLECKLNANMGVYVFNNSALEELLRDSKNPAEERHEFGRDIIPHAVNAGYDVRSYKHSGYWKPLRTLADIYEANISVATGGDAASLIDFDRLVYTKPNFLPPNTFYGSSLTERSIISDGCVIRDGAKIINSIVGPCTVIDKNVDLEGVVVVGRDEILKRSGGDKVADIGANTIIRKCMVDSDAVIGANVRILNEAGIQELDRTEDGYIICEGIVTILGGAVIPDGFTI